MKKNMQEKTELAIVIRGKDYGCIGMSEQDIDAAFEERIGYIERAGLFCGGSLMDEDHVECACEPLDGKPITIERWLAFAEGYHAAFPTFDGHIVLQNLAHLSSEDIKNIDLLKKLLKP